MPRKPIVKKSSRENDLLGSSKKSRWMLLAIACSIMLLSVAGTVFVTKQPAFVGGAGNYKNVTFTDAVITCEAAIRQEYGQAINLLYLDDHSSRFDNKRFVYKLFFNMTLRSAEGVSKNYVNCFVRAATGAVNTFEVLQEIEGKKDEAPPVDDGTNMFGFPKKSK